MAIMHFANNYLTDLLVVITRMSPFTVLSAWTIFCVYFYILLKNKYCSYSRKCYQEETLINSAI